MLKVELVMDVVDGYAPSKPIRLDTPIPRNGGGGQRDGQRPPSRPGNRPHGRPATRTTHAGPKQRSGGGQGAWAGRRDTRA